MEGGFCNFRICEGGGSKKPFEETSSIPRFACFLIRLVTLLGQETFAPPSFIFSPRLVSWLLLKVTEASRAWQMRGYSLPRTAVPE